MLVDESKMAIDSFFSFLNRRSSTTILNYELLFKIKYKPTLTEQIAPLTLLTKRLYEPITDAQTRLNCLRNKYLKSLTLRISEY